MASVPWSNPSSRSFPTCASWISRGSSGCCAEERRGSSLSRKIRSTTGAVRSASGYCGSAGATWSSEASSCVAWGSPFASSCVAWGLPFAVSCVAWGSPLVSNCAVSSCVAWGSTSVPGSAGLSSARPHGGRGPAGGSPTVVEQVSPAWHAAGGRSDPSGRRSRAGPWVSSCPWAPIAHRRCVPGHPYVGVRDRPGLPSRYGGREAAGPSSSLRRFLPAIARSRHGHAVRAGLPRR